MAFFLFIYDAKMKTEEQLLLHECGERYSAYFANVPRWFPTFRRYADPQGQWTWQGIAASKELKTVAWVTVFFVLLYFREEYLQEHELFSEKVWGKHLRLTLLAVGLIAGDGIFELLRKLRRRRAVAAAA